MDSNSNQLGRVRLAAGTTNAAGFADLFGSKPTNGSAVTKHPASNMITPVQPSASPATGNSNSTTKPITNCAVKA